MGTLMRLTSCSGTFPIPGPTSVCLDYAVIEDLRVGRANVGGWLEVKAEGNSKQCAVAWRKASTCVGRGRLEREARWLLISTGARDLVRVHQIGCGISPTHAPRWPLARRGRSRIPHHRKPEVNRGSSEDLSARVRGFLLLSAEELLRNGPEAFESSLLVHAPTAQCTGIAHREEGTLASCMN
jgi:hypothetical protein